MNKKVRIIVILGVLCLVLAAYALVTMISKDNENGETEIILSQIESDDVTAFSYQHHNDTEYTKELYSFVKEDGTWYYEADEAFPVHQLMADAKAKVIGTVTAQRIVAENPEDISQYGLDEPYLTVSVSDAKNTYVYHVGNYNESTTTYYIMQEGNDTVYLADSQMFIAFDLQLWDMISKEDTPKLNSDSFTEIDFQIKGQNIHLKKTKLDSDYVKSEWYLLDENGQIIENTNKVATAQYPKLLPEITYLREIDYKCEKADYGLYGFDNPEMVITIDYEENGKADSITFTVGSVTSENHIYEDYYIKSDKSDAVMTVNYEILEKISAISDENFVIE